MYFQVALNVCRDEKLYSTLEFKKLKMQRNKPKLNSYKIKQQKSVICANVFTFWSLAKVSKWS